MSKDQAEPPKEEPIPNAADYQALTQAIFAELAPDIAGLLARVDSHEARLEIIFVAILRQLRGG